MVACCLCSLGLLAPSSAGAWSVSPALLNSALAAGKVTLGTFEVTTADALGRHFRVVVQDLGETSAGAFTFNPATAAAHSAAPWISVLPRTFTATGKPQPVDYAIAVPADATPGDHVAAISVQEMPATNAGNIGVVEAVGLRATVRIKGPVNPAVRITRFTAPSVTFGGPVTASTTVVNVGDTVLDFDRANAGSALTIAGQRTLLTGVLLPGASRAIRVSSTSVPLLGSSRATLMINLGRGSVSRSRDTIVLPPLLLLALLILASLLAAAWTSRRYRRRQHPAMQSA